MEEELTVAPTEKALNSFVFRWKATFDQNSL
jgi:hypothetical protein